MGEIMCKSEQAKMIKKMVFNAMRKIEGDGWTPDIGGEFLFQNGNRVTFAPSSKWQSQAMYRVLHAKFGYWVGRLNGPGGWRIGKPTQNFTSAEISKCPGVLA